MTTGIAPEDFARAYAGVIDAAERAAHDDRDGALRAFARSRVNPDLLRECALVVYSGVMAGEGAAARFDEQRAAIHQLAEHLGAADGQVVLCLEVVGAAQALCEGDEQRVWLIASDSVFSALDHAHVAASLTGQAVAGWLGERAPEFFTRLRLQYGVEGAA